MPNNRMNKTIAGYHILMILSAVDYRITIHEDTVIRDYLVEEFPFRVNLDKQMEIISNLKHDEWETHYQKAMDDFYDDSTEEERHSMLRFAIKLTKADNVITKEENHYLNLLFGAWNRGGLIYCNEASTISHTSCLLAIMHFASIKKNIHLRLNLHTRKSFLVARVWVFVRTARYAP